MRHDDIPKDVREQAFDFFYWFSRFEFALKERGYLRRSTEGSTAEADWKAFVKKWEEKYTVTDAAKVLIAQKPQRQVVGPGELQFRDVGFDDKPSDLGKVVRLAKTVRNNLFHGGKHGSQSWDDPERMKTLLPLVITVLNEFAELAGFQDDYQRYY